jgi:hypothetical protein
VEAAYGLRILGDPEAVEHMCAQWVTITSDKKLRRVALDDFGRSDQPRDVLGFLASSFAPQAFSTLGNSVPALPANWRPEVIKEIGANLDASSSELYEASTPATRTAVEDALVGLLEDKTAGPEETERSDENPLIHPRICDYAARQLHKLWPDRYPFETGAAPAVRDRACIECQNVRLRALWKTPLPPPNEGRDPLRAPTDPNEVVSTAWSKDSLMANPEFARRLEGLRGLPLNGDTVAALFQDYASHPSKTGSGLEVLIWRFCGSGGVFIEARLLPGKPPAAESGYTDAGWGDFVGYSGTGVAFKNAAKLEKWESLREGLDEAIKAPPSRAYLIGANLKAR